MKEILNRIFPKIRKNKSIVFISLHKCATSYFSDYVLRNVTGYKLIDYLQYLYQHDQKLIPDIKKYGHIYGVIRLQEENHPRFNFVESFLAHPEFCNTRQVYFTRDPRDILVSSYYSFGFTHGISNVEDMKHYEIEKRENIRKQSLDEYVLNEAPVLRDKLLKMHNLIHGNTDCIHLKYEEMIQEFDKFFEKFIEYVPVNESIYDVFYKNTRPARDSGRDLHKRDGSIQGYQYKLRNSTVDELNFIFKDVIQYFNYQV